MTNNQSEGLSITVTGISSDGESGTVEVRVRVSDSVHEEQKSFILLPDIFMQTEVVRGVISRETYNLLETAGEFSLAALKGMSAVAHGDRSAKALTQNLIRKGIKKKYAGQAVKYLKSKGYINECESAIRIANTCTDKLWGLNRIISKLYADGYCDKAVKAAADSLSDYDFTAACVKYIRKKYGVLPDGRENLIKIMNSLKNYGYTAEQINRALNIVK